ncbi:MAG: hypothetical protein OHK0012_08350 [Synechococcales cyanobacterium]
MMTPTVAPTDPRLSLPIPPHFDPERVGEVWRVPYQQRAQDAAAWAKLHGIPPAYSDPVRLCLLIIDAQNTFCLPDFELYVGGRSGLGAIEDNRRLSEFIYRNLGVITTIIPTLDTHSAMQIFHPIFWVNAAGEHPLPAATQIRFEDVQQGIWQVNPAVAHSLGVTPETLHRHALHYTKTLTQAGKFPLTVWPYHSMLGGIGHALVSAVEEAVFFHGMARLSQPRFEIKGGNPLTENYSALQPEVVTGADGQPIAPTNSGLMATLLECDALVIAGQAKSHCVAWTVDDLLREIQSRDPGLAAKVYLLEDCSSPVVVPDVVDFTEMADAAYARFAEAGMHRVYSTDPLETWPGLARSGNI